MYLNITISLVHSIINGFIIVLNWTYLFAIIFLEHKYWVLCKYVPCIAEHITIYSVPKLREKTQRIVFCVDSDNNVVWLCNRRAYIVDVHVRASS